MNSSIKPSYHARGWFKRLDNRAWGQSFTSGPLAAYQSKLKASKHEHFRQEPTQVSFINWLTILTWSFPCQRHFCRKVFEKETTFSDQTFNFLNGVFNHFARTQFPQNFEELHPAAELSFDFHLCRFDGGRNDDCSMVRTSDVRLIDTCRIFFVVIKAEGSDLSKLERTQNIWKISGETFIDLFCCFYDWECGGEISRAQTIRDMLLALKLTLSRNVNRWRIIAV